MAGAWAWELLVEAMSWRMRTSTMVSGGARRPVDSTNPVRRIEAWWRRQPPCSGVARAAGVGGLAHGAARTKQDICIGGADINAGDAPACCFSFTMAGANVTRGVITGGDGADAGGGAEVISVAAIVGGGEAVGEAAGGERVAAAGIADWAVAGGEEGSDAAAVPRDGDVWIGGVGSEES